MIPEITQEMIDNYSVSPEVAMNIFKRDQPVLYEYLHFHNNSDYQFIKVAVYHYLLKEAQND